MAGKHVTTVVDQTKEVDFTRPIGLCVDTDRQRVYWYDKEYRSISTSKYDGSDFILFRPAHDFFILNLAVYMVSSHTIYRVRQNKTPQHENRNFSEMREYFCIKFCVTCQCFCYIYN